MCQIPSPQVKLRSGIDLFDRTYDSAIETVRFNIKPWQDGLLQAEAPAIMAGEGYHKPWTRDAAYNTWNAGGLLFPQTARNTLLSTLKDGERGTLIAGQYWDAIAWTTGAWAYYCVTGDEAFLRLAYEATVHSLRHFEQTELDPAVGLFNGPASTSTRSA